MKNRTRSFTAFPDVVFIVDKAKSLRKAIADVPPTQDTVDFRDLLVGVLNCAIEDFYSVMVGAEESVSLMAWGCRNLLEVRILTLFALSSEENARQVITDSIVDGAEFFEAFSKYQRLSHAQMIEESRATIAAEKDEQVRRTLQMFVEVELIRGTDTTPLDVQANEYRQRLTQERVKESARPIMSGDMAKKVGLKDHFDALNRVFSKIVHRTSLSIAATLQNDSLVEVVAPFHSYSALALLYVVVAIESHFLTNGIAWPRPEPS